MTFEKQNLRIQNAILSYKMENITFEKMLEILIFLFEKEETQNDTDQVRRS